MSSQITELLSKLLEGIPANGALRAHVELLRDRVHVLVQENESLHRKIKTLEREADERQEDRLADAMSKQYVEHRGGGFRVGRGGKYEEDVYCLFCHVVMTSFCGQLPYRCSTCGRSLNFTGSELKKVMAGLPQS